MSERRVRLNKRRVPLGRNTTVIDPPVPVLVTAFGIGKVGQMVVGNAVSRTKGCITVEFADEDGKWSEEYSAETGVRLSDVDAEEGWKITLSDLEKGDLTAQGRLTPKGTGVKCLYRERIPTGERSAALFEVWHDTNNGELFLKGCTEETNEKDVTKQYVRLIPFAFLKKALADFCIDWG